MVQTALLVEVDDLERLQNLGQLTGSNIGIDIEDLTILRLREGGEDGKTSILDGALDWLLVDIVNLADETIFLLVKIASGEGAEGNRSSTGAEGLELLYEALVLLEKDLASYAEGPGV